MFNSYPVCNIYTTVFRGKRLNNRMWNVILFNRLTPKSWYNCFVTWSHAISHLGRWLLYGSLRILKLQPRFKVCNISYLRLLTNLLYYDYKCLCFINLMTGNYKIYGALIQGIMEKVVNYEKQWPKWPPNFNTFAWVLFLSFLT